MLYVELFHSGDSRRRFHRVNSSYPLLDTIEAAELTLLNRDFQWADSFYVVDGDEAIMAAGIRRDDA